MKKRSAADQLVASGVIGNPPKERTAIVRLDGVRVGTLVERGSDTIFTYDSAWLSIAGAIPISVTIPLHSEPYVSSGLHPFFENLLPEGWLLELATQKLKIAKDDEFGMLIATCANCAGAVEVPS